MRFMIMHYNDADAEAGAMPSQEFIEKIGAFIGAAAESGKLLVGEGVWPTSKGARITAAKGKTSVVDGPFAEAKEVIGGFLIINVASKQEAVDFARQYAELFGDIQVDVRQLVEGDDIPS